MNLDPIARYRALDLYARQVVEGFITGRHRSPFHGFSAEFSDYRQYNPGESTRNIDYRLYGRTDRLYVKQFEEETNLRCQIFIDCSGSMLFPLEQHAILEHPNKLTFSVYATAVLIELLHRQRDAFGLTLFSPHHADTQPQAMPVSLTHTPCRSNRVHQQYLLGLLDTLLQPIAPKALSKQHPSPDQNDPSLPAALHLTAERLHRRSLVVVFTDAFVHDTDQEPLLDALRHLRHNKHEVILFHTYDQRHELELDYTARPHLFIDLESGQQLRLNPTEIAEAYRRQMHETFDTLQHRALQYHIDYQPVDVGLGFHQILLPFLLKRSKL